MVKFIKNKPIISLLIFSIISGFLWRLEIGLHGWRGFKWLTYFHWSFVITLILFLVWFNLQVKSNLIKRLAINFLYVTFILVLFIGIVLTCLVFYNPHIIKFIAFVKIGPNANLYAKILWVVIIISSPFIYKGILNSLEIKTTIKTTCFSMMLFWISIPLTIGILLIINHKGGTNGLVALKSGFAYPLMIFSLGIALKSHFN